MRVIFWGTPEFAIPSLRAIERAGHMIVGVVSQPERPRGRGRKPAPSPVAALAQARSWRVLTPVDPRDGAFVDELGSLGADISVVVAYGRILSRAVLDVPPLGSINLHASLLPALRGAAPITWAIARGHAVTGVTVMRMVEEMDAGPILAKAECPIGLADTGALLSARLAGMGAALLAETLARLDAGPVEEVQQDHARATFAPKVDRSSARIDWGFGRVQVARLVRAMDDVPGAWSVWRDQPVKLFGARDAGGAGDPGRVVQADPRRGLAVAAGDGVVRIAEVQPPGKRRMEAAAWIRGRGPGVGDRFE
ncbi:MAG: methionyl-tRNA formyltransferase [Gemmatimonadetes bacterium]|nr:methionyl-tRNA formyltransferase [Gemmatimonadota bacterium]